MDISTLDEEELARGYPRAADGSFRNPPVVIPRAIHARMMRELYERANATLKKNLGDAATTMTRIMNNEEIDPKTRMDAAKWLIERVMGKTPDITVNVDEKRFEKMFDRIERGEPVSATMVIDGDVLDGYEP